MSDNQYIIAISELDPLTISSWCFIELNDMIIHIRKLLN